MRIVKSGEVKQGVAEGLCGKACDIARVCLAGTDQLFDKRGLCCSGLGQQSLGVGFLDLSGLDERASKAAE